MSFSFQFRISDFNFRIAGSVTELLPAPFRPIRSSCSTLQKECQRWVSSAKFIPSISDSYKGNLQHAPFIFDWFLKIQGFSFRNYFSFNSSIYIINETMKNMDSKFPGISGGLERTVILTVNSNCLRFIQKCCWVHGERAEREEESAVQIASAALPGQSDQSRQSKRQLICHFQQPLRRTHDRHQLE